MERSLGPGMGKQDDSGLKEKKERTTNGKAMSNQRGAEKGGKKKSAEKKNAVDKSTKKNRNGGLWEALGQKAGEGTKGVRDHIRRGTS